MDYLRRNRDEYCALLTEKGPDAPTLCNGWTTRDVAAHSVVREGRLDAMIGLRAPRIAGHTARVQSKAATRHSYPQLIEMIRQGPPRLSIFQLPGLAGFANFIEFYVHGEDVRRGAPGWEPRQLDPIMEDILWRKGTAVSKLILSEAPCGVVLRWDGRPDAPLFTAKKGTPEVTVTGTPGEIVLWVLGRTSAAQVRLDGDPSVVEQMTQHSWGL